MAAVTETVVLPSAWPQSPTLPQPVAEVVDSVLQIIAGLESARRAGILHRDIKPSNCFIEADGTVKIGDFGLSISTFVRTEPAITATGAFLGTPAFSSPEQLRGDELTVRSDIYSVGVTLYYLLTGHHPFEAPDMVRLLATVLERPAESPAKRRPGLPSGLCRAVLRCLEKDPEKRFRNYDELRNALLSYASTAPTPATLGLRFLAYCLDMLLLALVNLLIMDGVHAATNHLTVSQTPKVLLEILFNTALVVLYYGLLEGLSGASVGKAICRLRVARLDRTVPGVPRALLRALVLTVPGQAVWLLGWVVTHAWRSGPSLDGWMMVINLISIGMTPLIALAGPVAQRVCRLARPCQRHPGHRQVGLSTTPRAAAGRRGSAEDGDPAPDVSRPGRLRWLSAKRTDAEAWNAYEATPGQPLLALVSEPQEWSRVRYWLLDLAEELQAATQDGSLPTTLRLDRVWITADGRAKLLDFPTPAAAGLQPNRPAEFKLAAPSPLTFLGQVALSALEGRPVNSGDADPGTAKVPLAVHASRFLETLKPGANLGERIAQLRSLLGVPAEIPRARRLALLVGVLAFPVLFTLPMHVLIVCYGITVVFVVLPCLIASLLFRGGALVKLLGIVFVDGYLAVQG